MEILIFLTCLLHSENFIKFSTPNGPTEYTTGVTSTELFGKVETTMTFLIYYLMV